MYIYVYIESVYVCVSECSFIYCLYTALYYLVWIVIFFIRYAKS